MRDPGSVSDTAAIESAASRDTDPDPSEFARRVVLGDGASWIWRSASEDYPGAIQIVDLRHAKEKLWEVAKVLFAHDKLLVEPWADARCDDLEQGRLDGLLATLRAHAGTCEQAGKCANYIEKNRSRMRYPEFRAQGLCVGSWAPAWWSPAAARWSDASSARECTGPSAGLTPSSPCAAAFSAATTRTSGLNGPKPHVQEPKSKHSVYRVRIRLGIGKLLI